MHSFCVFYFVSVRVSRGSRGEVYERSFLLAPVLVKPHSPPTSSKLYGVATFSTGMSEDTITVLVYTNPTDPPQSLQCTGKLVSHACMSTHGI